MSVVMSCGWNHLYQYTATNETLIPCVDCGNDAYAPEPSAAETRSPGRQMRPMNPTGDPRSYHGWSVWQPMHSLCFAKNISEEKWTDNSLISYPWFITRLQSIANAPEILQSCMKPLVCLCVFVWIKCEYRLAHFDQFFNWFYGLSIHVLLTDHPELRRTTQPSIMGGPLGDPGFCFFRSTVSLCHYIRKTAIK